ncbi:LysR substrate-binding domain-containing protein [Xinfangfangia sp. CPCC 101601]|uniref:LysR substrate-binding domain-containing protein n=1 Tax=Pseudogemmobacter lacusdianii TaxID=3069608 RepID=A0ABU0VVX4_9RHOB|nr:LysR substrate-binding domain-containing protein [Xinfangfangia sp. CPCC 101601]MDQ2065904.1 LysR substrate-binding domain-containing protein [Xinfangfangia sp. CPCC 101601]
MRLTHRQLEIFRSLMQTLSVTETAAELYSSQPTISRELKALEDSLGFVLFLRDKRRLEVTPRAIALHSIVQRSFVSLDEIGRAADAIRGDRLQRIAVACLPAFAHALMPQTIDRFRALHKDAAIKVHSIEESVLTRELLNKIFDLGVVEGRVPGGLGSLEQRDLGNLLCVMPADHPLSRYKCLEVEQMEGSDFIYYSEEDSYRRQIDALFDTAGVSRNLMVETTTATSIGGMVSQGIGISIVNPLTALAFEGNNLTVRPLAKTIPYSLNIWQPDPVRQSQWSAGFMDALRQTLDDIVERLTARELI